MTKVAIKNENITSYGGIYHIMDVFSKLGFERLTESVLGKRGSSGKAFCYGSIFLRFFIHPHWFGWGILCLEKPQETPHINIQSPKKTSQHIKFSHKKKYCGIKDIRVLFYSSILQKIIVFPFIVLKYFSFCCYSSHSILFWNPLVYSCFILIVKSDSKLILNSSCQLSILFNLFVIHLCLQPVFHFSNLTFLISDCIFYAFCLSCYSVFFITLSLCHSVFCHSVFPIILSLCHSVSCHSVSFHVFVALPLPFFPFHFGLIFTLSSVYFLIFLLEYLSI